jgi:putative tryptophan/tyrosine transport system substrate-binding protein
MRRREFITLFGAAAAASWPFAVRAQQAGKLPTIGFLGAGSPSGWSNWTAAFLQRLHELGWVEGRTIAIEYRWAEGHSERYAEIAAEYVRLKVDVIVSVGSAAIVAKQVTSVVPIVFTLSADPIGDGVVASLARPGGNVTGLSIQAVDVAGKRLELLREVIPNLRRLAILTEAGNLGSALERSKVATAAKMFGIEVVILEMRSADDIAAIFAAIKHRAEALYVLTNPLANTNRAHINALALAEHLPTMHGFREYAEAGGLMSYGPNTADLFRRAGDYVDKILKGAKPSDLPIEQPTKFELVINLKTAKTLGLTVPATLLALADEVLE